MTQLTQDQNTLYELMSDISEAAYCAGWSIGNEYRLWAMLVEPNDSRVYTRTIVTQTQIDEMRMLSERIGGWIDYVAEEDIPRELWGERFVPTEKWLQMFKSWREKYPYPLN